MMLLKTHKMIKITTKKWRGKECEDDCSSR